MKVEFWMIGKTSFSYLEEGMAIYEKRLKHYLSINLVTVPDIKNAKHLSPQELKSKEGSMILNKIKTGDVLILLDENGKEFSSLRFAAFMEKQMIMPHKRIIFLVGGAYGFSSEIYAKADFKISLSKMTFSHQMIRLFFLEQLYRAMTILKGEPYHNQ